MKVCKKAWKNSLWALLLLGGIALMAAGAARGELGVVLARATNICMECIGIG
ncbi:MAG: thioredoxin [Clostridiales bacterium]|nr:thioredoxin [Clostridiales bacterium]